MIFFFLTKKEKNVSFSALPAPFHHIYPTAVSGPFASSGIRVPTEAGLQGRTERPKLRSGAQEGRGSSHYPIGGRDRDILRLPWGRLMLARE